MSEYHLNSINKIQYVGSGNSKQRRRLRRYLRRLAIPLVEKNTPLSQIATMLGIRFQTLSKFLLSEGYIQSAWMYRKVGKVSTL